MSVNIVRTEFSSEATLPAPPESGGRLRHLARRVLRRLGLMGPGPQPTFLFQANMGAYRFVTDDGRVAVVPVSMALVHDTGVDAEALAREWAIPKLEALDRT